MNPHYDAMADYRQARARAVRIHTAVELLDQLNEATADEYNDEVLEGLLDKLEKHLSDKLHAADHSVSLHALNIMADAT